MMVWWSGKCQVNTRLSSREFQVKCKISQLRLGKGLVRVRGRSNDGHVVR